MNSERQRLVTATFESTAELSANERAIFLDRVCSGDAELRAEVDRLLASLDQAGSFLSNPIVEGMMASGRGTPEPALRVGRIVSGRYRVEMLLGRGGMGEVYRVHDSLLQETVALKILRPELAADPGLSRRFHREVLLSRRVSHANVCRVFDAGFEHDGVVPLHYFTMQLILGETLSQRIKRLGSISKEVAYPIIEQLCEGLAAAHRMGIIHRDFKSGNVILSDTAAIITDFGLARLDSTALVPTDPSGLGPATITVNHELAGTVAYMSPEQLTGGQVTNRSDIYSLGVVLFEMATGQIPFSSDVAQSTNQKAIKPAPDPGQIAPKLDARWRAAILRCLERDADKRFSDTEAVVRALRSRNPLGTMTRRDWARTTAAAAASVACVSLFPTARRLWIREAVMPPGAEVLLSPIVNSTGDSKFDGITELFRNQLAQSVQVNVAERGELAAVLRQMGKPEDSTNPADIQEAAWRSNAALWISGTVARIGTDYALSIQFETRGSQPKAPRSKELKSFPAADDRSLMRSVRDAALWIRETIGESQSNIASFDRLPADVTTSSWIALSMYARGEQHFMRQQFERAILEFQAALHEDPQFTLAAVRCADLLTTQHRQSEGFPLWRSAMRVLKERPLTRPEELYARGMFATDTGDMNAAEREFRTWSVEYRHEWRAPFYRMLPLVLQGHAAEALSSLEPVRAAMPEYADVYVQMIACHLVLMQTAEARSLIPFVRKYEDSTRADLREAYCDFCEGNCAGYLERLRTIRKARTTSARGAIDAMIREALLLIDANRAEAAASESAAFLSDHSAADIKGQMPVLLIVQAWAEMLSGNNAAAIQHAREAVNADTGAILVTLAGSIFARLGARSLQNSAVGVCEKLQDFPIYKLGLQRILGEGARAAGNRERAIGYFQDASILEPTIAHRPYLIEVLPAGAELDSLCLNVFRRPWQFLRPPPLHNLGSISNALGRTSNTNGVIAPFAAKFASSSAQLHI